MRRILIVLIICWLTISACASTPPIWGVQETPTPNSPELAPPPFDPFVVNDSQIIFPTSTIPPEIATQLASTPTVTPVDMPPLINPTYTPALDSAPFLYYAQSGDMLSAIASRFGVEESEITSDADLTRTTLIDPGTLLVIPNHIYEPTTPNIQIMPDAEVIFSSSAIDFDVDAYVQSQNGYLSDFREYLGSTGWVSGPGAVERPVEVVAAHWACSSMKAVGCAAGRWITFISISRWASTTITIRACPCNWCGRSIQWPSPITAGAPGP